MANCTARRGFLTLHDCGNPASTNCVSCSRPICSEHLSPRSGFTQCLDCFARGASQDPAAAKATADDEYDPEWSAGYRRSYYGSGYRPIYSGYYGSTYYDDYDVRSFDAGASHDAADVDDDDRGTSFGDS
jgi:hypothetical protein